MFLVGIPIRDFQSQLASQTVLLFPKHANLQSIDRRSQIWRGFPRHRSIKFHPSVKGFILQCKIGQPFGEFTNGQEHIIMNTAAANAKKYLTVHRPLTLVDIHAHVAGIRTLGGTLNHADGTTRALCFDTDEKPTDRVTCRMLQSLC